MRECRGLEMCHLPHLRTRGNVRDEKCPFSNPSVISLDDKCTRRRVHLGEEHPNKIVTFLNFLKIREWAHVTRVVEGIGLVRTHGRLVG